MIKPKIMQFKKINNTTIAYSSPLDNSIKSEHFSPEYWKSCDKIVGSSCGRRTTWFVQQRQKPWVLRHYWRGGFMAKFSDDLYCYSGIHQTRPIAELQILEQMHQLGLPVPRPIAAKVERVGLWYRGDIIIELIENAEDLFAVLSQRSMPEALWVQLGSLIARFHNHGVYHADLNIKNIMLAEDLFYLIDFDRGELKTPKRAWQNTNIARLRRSLDKEKGKLRSLHFDEQNWQDLLTGYQAIIK